MKNIAAWSGIGILAGLLFSFYADNTVKLIFCISCMALAAALFITGMVLSGLSDVGKSAAVILLFAALASAYNIIFTTLRAEKLSALSGQEVVIDGYVSEITESDVQRVTVSGKINGISTKIQLYLNGQSVDCGDVVTLSATLRSVSDDDRSYLYPRGYYAGVSSYEIVDVRSGEGLLRLYRIIKDYSDYISAQIRLNTYPEAGELLSAMLCGDDPVLSDSLRRDMNRSGVGHVMSVSGLHVSVITATVAALLRRLRANKYVLFLASESIMTAFIIFSGMSVSSVRAFIMMSIYLVSGLVNREYSGTSAITASVILITAFNPYAAADPSLLMSVTGVFGVSVASKTVISSLKINSRIVKAIMPSLCAAICTTPVTAFFFDEISIVSLFANMIFVPVCSAALCLCMLFALLGGFYVFRILIKAAELLAGLTIGGCRLLSETRISYVPIKYDFIPIVLLIASAAVFAFYFVKRDVRATAIASVCGYFMAVVMIFAAMFAGYNSVVMNISTYDGEFLCVISCKNECIVIDSDCSFASDCEDVLSKNGVTKIRAAIILSNGVSGYSSYLSGEIVPDIILTGDAELTGSDRVGSLYPGSTIEAFGMRITVYSNDKIGIAEISENSEEIIISKSYSDGEHVITVLDGVTVIYDGGKRSVLDDSVERRWVLGDSLKLIKH